MTRQFHCLLGTLMVFVLSLRAGAASPRVAILGDSITYGGRWATLVESALRGTPEFAEAEIVNFGLGSETVSGLSEPGHAGGKFPRPCLHERLDRILDAYQPTLVLACYGMNDGIYLPPDAARFQAYRDGIEKLKTTVENQGGKIIFITPPLYNADKPSDDPYRYDAVLDHFSYYLATRPETGWQVINIRPDLKKAVATAKREQPGFIYSKDNIHPGDEGHDFIAKSICDQLWPMLKLPGSPRFAQGEALAVLLRRNELLKLAWLTKTRHIRPGIPAGLPLDEADAQAKILMEEYRRAAPAISE